MDFEKGSEARSDESCGIMMGIKYGWATAARRSVIGVSEARHVQRDHTSTSFLNGRHTQKRSQRSRSLGCHPTDRMNSCSSCMEDLLERLRGDSER